MRKWRDAIQILFELDGGFVNVVEEYKSKSLNKKVYLQACKCYSKIKKHKETIEFCGRVLDIESENLEARINRGYAYLLTEEYDFAKNDFSKAHEMDRSNQRVFLLIGN